MSWCNCRRADINQNGYVDIADVATLAAAFGCKAGQSCYNPAYDLDGDGQIGLTDISCVGSLLGEYVHGDSVNGYYCNQLLDPEFKAYSNTAPFSWLNWAGSSSGSGARYPIGSAAITSYKLPSGYSPYSLYPVQTPELSPIGYVGMQTGSCTYSGDDLRSRFPSNPDCSSGTCACATVGVAQNINFASVGYRTFRGDIRLIPINIPTVQKWAYAQICYAIYGDPYNYALIYLNFTSTVTQVIFETMAIGSLDRYVWPFNFNLSPLQPYQLVISGDSSGTFYSIGNVSYKSSLDPIISSGWGPGQVHAYIITDASLAGIPPWVKAPSLVTTPQLGVMWGNATAGIKLN